ncbi:MAG: 30S ribosomal protein S21 [Patescibacteria group bacterium]
MVVITKRKGDTKDSMLRKFTKTFIEEDMINELRDKQYYKKPSRLKKEKEKERLRGKYSKTSKSRR